MMYSFYSESYTHKSPLNYSILYVPYFLRVELSNKPQQTNTNCSYITSDHSMFAHSQPGTDKSLKLSFENRTSLITSKYRKRDNEC